MLLKQVYFAEHFRQLLNHLIIYTPPTPKHVSSLKKIQEMKKLSPAQNN